MAVLKPIYRVFCGTLWLAAALSACGDPLADTSYRGEPLFKLDGQISTVETLSSELREANFAVSMFWSPNDPIETTTLIEQPSVTTTVRFPSTFTLRVFEPPAAEHFSSSDAQTAFGLVLVYVDADNDQHFDASAGDKLVGGSTDRGLVYALSDVAAEDSPSGEALVAGFNVVDLPLQEQSCAMMMWMMGMRGGGDGPEFGCGGERGCPPGTTCDPSEMICASSEVFELVIRTRFELQHAFCGRAP